MIVLKILAIMTGLFLAFLLWFVLQITYLGKRTSGLSRAEAIKQLCLEIVGMGK